jgi:hypothetical protein
MFVIGFKIGIREEFLKFLGSIPLDYGTVRAEKGLILPSQV